MAKNKKAISSKEFDEKFDRGDDISEYIDLETATKRFNLDLPVWAVKAVDQEARRRGIARQAMIKTWIIDKLDELKAKMAG